MDADIKKRTEWALAVVSVSTAALVVCFSVALAVL
jgi:hypothetical protein